MLGVSACKNQKPTSTGSCEIATQRPAKLSLQSETTA